MRENDFNISKNRNDYNEALQKTKRKCIIGNCNNLSINSHTISKSVLKKAQDGDNNFIWLQKDKKQIGINKLFTYHVFCREHDNDIFEKIDNNEYCVGDKEQEFLFYYRCLAAEYVRNINKLDFLKSKNHFPDINGGVVLSNNWTLIEKSVDFSKSCYEDFEKHLMEKNYNVIETRTFIFDDVYGVVGAQFFDFVKTINDDYVYLQHGIVINIFTQKRKTYVVISYSKIDEEKLCWENKLLDEMSNDIEKQTFISVIALAYFQNIGFSESLWKSFSQEYKERIETIYKKSEIDICNEKIDIFLENFMEKMENN